MKGDLYRAPIGKPKTILDAGTGTGIWAILFARQFPEVNVVASDLSPIQPPNAPSNFTFVQGDMEEPWGYEKPFDYIHLRMMCTCFSAPKKIIQNVFDNLAPGGWCEYQEFAPESIHGSDPASDQLLRSSAFYRATDLVILGMKNLGRDISVAHKYKQWMEEVGFTDIVEEKILCPLNDWPLDPEQRALGKIYREHAEVGVGSMVKLLLAAGAKMDEIPQIQEGVNKALSDTNLRAYATCKLYMLISNIVLIIFDLTHQYR